MAKSYNDAKLDLQRQAFSCGVALDMSINGKKCTVDEHGCAHLDGVKVQNMEKEVLQYIPIDEDAIKEEMTK